MTDNTKYEVTQADIETAAVRWCGDKERETFPEDIDYFKQNWRALPGLRKYVEEAARHRLTSQPARSDQEPVAFPLMNAAFRTTQAGPSGYTMTFKFPDIDALHAADDEWRAARDASTPTAPQPDRESVLPDHAKRYLAYMCAYFRGYVNQGGVSLQSEAANDSIAEIMELLPDEYHDADYHIPAFGADEGPWRCFHCNALFEDREAAHFHFGESEDEIAACLLERGITHPTTDTQSDAVREAVLAERERCAKIAENRIANAPDDSRQSDAQGSTTPTDDWRYGYRCGIEGRTPIVMNMPESARQDIRDGHGAALVDLADANPTKPCPKHGNVACSECHV